MHALGTFKEHPILGPSEPLWQSSIHKLGRGEEGSDARLFHLSVDQEEPTQCFGYVLVGRNRYITFLNLHLIPLAFLPFPLDSTTCHLTDIILFLLSYLTLIDWVSYTSSPWYIMWYTSPHTCKCKSKHSSWSSQWLQVLMHYRALMDTK